jgi:hypothetical protein
MMARLSRALLWLCCAIANLVAAQSGIFEIDLVFPKNGTWSSTSGLPIVFAVQQPQLGVLVQRQVIRWTLNRESNSFNSSGFSGQVTFETNATASNQNLFIATGFTNAISGIEGDWAFRWQVSTRNCSLITSDNALTTFSSSSQGRGVGFRTSKSAPVPNIDTALALDACRDSRWLAYNVSAVQKIPEGSDALLSSSCAALAAQPTVTGNPCAVTISAAASSSASAAISYSACQATSTACASPTTTTKPSAADRPESRSFLLWLVVGALGLVAA